jgi:hypothetical protein
MSRARKRDKVWRARANRVAGGVGDASVTNMTSEAVRNGLVLGQLDTAHWYMAAKGPLGGAKAKAA